MITIHFITFRGDYAYISRQGYYIFFRKRDYISRW